ncbi:tripartite tricarboxylate transporter TctB family protein [Metabacillus niabensis]|uniref:tripartite tricarboxylate transporter TctB family protein n=1 Tax=Metabacillus niabensis TaxID=324854 RepID=UPI001CFA6625|nr:tripartite tricarboxylate transporter TctB family protein [Metabacillus niabensis]
MARLNKDIFASAFLILFSIVMYMASNSIIKLTVSKVGADFVPKLVAIGMLILSVFYLISSVKQQIKSKSEAASKIIPNKENNTEEKKKIRPLSVLLTVGLLVLYIALLPYIGFLITTTVYLFFQMYVLAAKTERRIVLFIGISIATSIFIYFIFKYVFYLMLPTGILG